jgi:hypothetical protein
MAIRRVRCCLTDFLRAGFALTRRSLWDGGWSSSRRWSGGRRQLVVGLNIVEIAEATHDMPECLLRVRRLEAGQEELESPSTERPARCSMVHGNSCTAGEVCRRGDRGSQQLPSHCGIGRQDVPDLVRQRHCVSEQSCVRARDLSVRFPVIWRHASRLRGADVVRPRQVRRDLRC